MGIACSAANEQYVSRKVYLRTRGVQRLKCVLCKASATIKIAICALKQFSEKHCIMTYLFNHLCIYS